jgi:hypothetical protein
MFRHATTRTDENAAQYTAPDTAQATSCQQLRYTTTLAHARAHLIARHTHAHSSFILRGTRAQAQVPAPRSLTCPRIKRARRRWHPPVCVLGTSATRPRQARTNLRFEHVRQPVLGVAVGNTLASAVYSTHTHTHRRTSHSNQSVSLSLVMESCRHSPAFIVSYAVTCGVCSHVVSSV